MLAMPDATGAKPLGSLLRLPAGDGPPRLALSALWAALRASNPALRPLSAKTAAVAAADYGK
ncbi:hypothetical protein SedNR2807_03500 [Citrobacter sedlakii]